MTPELSEGLMPYAEWLEDFIRSIVEMKPVRIGVCAVGENGKPNTQFRQRKYDPYMGWYWSKMGSCRVVHWMPLPEPVKEDTHEE